ncbi:MAG: hypothetical protein ACKVVT_17775 [Dehalococcoidia bacterium]
MKLTDDDTFLRRLIAESHLARARGQTGWERTRGVFKIRSAALPDGRRRASVGVVRPGHGPAELYARDCGDDGRCGVGSISHASISGAGGSVSHDPEGGNEYHCSLEFPDDLVTAFRLAQACRVEVWPTTIPPETRLLLPRPSPAPTETT